MLLLALICIPRSAMAGIPTAAGNTVATSEDTAHTFTAADNISPTAPTETGPEPTEILRQELVLMDPATRDYQQLTDDILAQSDEERTIEVVLLDSQEDGIGQISDILSGYSNLAAVHLISHGGAGEIHMGDGGVGLAALQAQADAVTAWSAALDENEDFLIYGCDLASTGEGELFVDTLAQLTGADVAASDDLTGHRSLGGNWDLEVQVGDIESGPLIDQQAQDLWVNALALPAFTGLDGTPGFTEDGAAVVLNADVVIADADLDALNSGNGDYSGASVTLGRNAVISTDDVFSFADGNGITLETSTSLNKTVLQKSGATIGIFDTTTIPGELRIPFTNANGQTPTSVDVDNILRQITYANSSDAPPASAQIDWTFDDGSSGQATGSATVTITAVNDAPDFETASFVEKIVSTSGNGPVDVSFADVDGDGDRAYSVKAVDIDSDAELDALNSGNGDYDGASVTLSRNGGANADDVFSHTGSLGILTQGGNLVYGTTTIGTVTTNSAGTLVLSFNTNATSTLVDATLRAIAYSNSSNAPPANAQIDWSFSDGNTGSQGTGGALDVVGSNTVTIEVTQAQDDSYSTSEDETLNVPANGVLGNDPPGVVSGPETAGHTLSYDAANDGDATWNDDNATGFDWTIGNFGTDVTYTNSPTTAYSGITAAYHFTGAGGATTNTFQDLPGNPTDSSASFEIWFRPEVFSGQKMLFETGGNDNGTSFYLDGAELVFTTEVSSEIRV
ncbi:MAG: DUF4347 domain-containing protein, partial [Sulfitobacter sp.]|nr:DUF4347 domain-containing protein [Sulfitobacter sp.]